jgi:hypothetical protein
MRRDFALPLEKLAFGVGTVGGSWAPRRIIMSSDRQNAIPTTGDPKHLRELLREFSTVLLGTFEQTGHALRSRRDRCRSPNSRTTARSTSSRGCDDCLLPTRRGR